MSVLKLNDRNCNDGDAVVWFAFAHSNVEGGCNEKSSMRFFKNGRLCDRHLSILSPSVSRHSELQLAECL